jgi:hypothetical protein
MAKKVKHVNGEILQAIADGYDVQYRAVGSGPGWTDYRNYATDQMISPLEANSRFAWRVKPQTVTIGRYDVPVPLDLGSVVDKDKNYFLVKGFDIEVISGARLLVGHMSSRLVQETYADAALHRQALLDFNLEVFDNV